jgi:hypothetical protein
MRQLYLPHKQNILVRKLEEEITEPRKKAAREEGRKLFNYELFDLSHLLNVVQVIKSRGVRRS